MKVRCGFVTNSSSSSFIIAYKSFDELEVIASQYPQIRNLLKFYHKFISGGGDIIKTKQDLDDKFVENYGYKDQTLEQILEDDDYLKEDYEKQLKAINDGYNIIEKCVDNSDEFTPDFLSRVEDGENMIILGGDC